MKDTMRTFYHLGCPYSRESIYRNGLKPGTRTGGTIEYENRLFLFSDRNDLPWNVVGGDVKDLWEVKIPEGVEVEVDSIAFEDGHKTSWKTGWHVPPENIRYIKSLPHPDEYQFGLDEGLVICRENGVPLFELEPAEPFHLYRRPE